jgi:predicted nucleic acid-binding Zn ribbon protein
MSARICRHCGAALSEGEREDECSSALNVEAKLRWQAAQILRGLI